MCCNYVNVIAVYSLSSQKRKTARKRKREREGPAAFGTNERDKSAMKLVIRNNTTKVNTVHWCCACIVYTTVFRSVCECVCMTIMGIGVWRWFLNSDWKMILVAVSGVLVNAVVVFLCVHEYMCCSPPHIGVHFGECFPCNSLTFTIVHTICINFFRFGKKTVKKNSNEKRYGLARRRSYK